MLTNSFLEKRTGFFGDLNTTEMLYDGGSANGSYGVGIESSTMWFNSGAAYKFYIGGAVASTIASNGAYTQVSDGRLKTDIAPLDHALDNILMLRGVTYHWKDPARGKERQVGVIAQEVEKVYPELIAKTESGDLTVNYSGLVSPLIQAVKVFYHKWFDDSRAIHREIASIKAEADAKTAELEAENVKLKVRADKAEKENAEIKARLDRIEKALKEK